jgi:c-di-GMP-binding flagellar brake protein YcgR
MGRRQQKRLRIALPVTVSGLDNSGKEFTQSSTTVDISPRGVRLSGVRCLRARGDPVQLEYKHKRARYRVAWIGQPGTSDDDLAGLEGLEGAQFLFGDHLPAASFPTLSAEADTYCTEPQAAADHAAVERREAERRQEMRRQDERRRHPRINCVGTARIWEEGQKHDISGRINEISLGGCYVEMMAPVRIGTAIRLELAINSSSIRLEGIVRASQPYFGMGIEFTKIIPAESEKLHRLIAELNGEVVPETPPAPVQQSPRADNVPGKELGDALLRWFGSHDTLTRQDFLTMMEQLIK